MSQTISVKDLAQALQSSTPPFLLDVREPEEYRLANLGGTLIPLGELTQRIDEVPHDREIVVLCHHGVRSGHAAAFLRHQGYERVRNISGGIDRYSIEVDANVPRY